MLWTPDPDEARGSRIAGFARWVREHRDVGRARTSWTTRACTPGPCATSTDSGPRVAEHLGVIFHDPPTATLGRREMPGTAVVPGCDAQLRRARADPRPRPGRRRRRGDRDRGGRVRAATRHPRRAARPGRAGPRGPGRGRCRAAATGSSRWRRTPSRPWSPSSRRPRSAPCGRRARRTSGRAPCSTASPRSSPPCCVAVDGYRYNGRPFDVRETVAALQKALPTLRATVLVPHLDPEATLDGHGPVGGAHRHGGAVGVHARAVRPPAVGALLVGDDRPAEGHRAVARRDRRRAPQGARAPVRPRPRRPVPVVHHHRLDDVELPRRRAARRRDARALRRQPGPPGPGRAVGRRSSGTG